MKMLKKLALVSAVSMISAGAFAMEAMDDESMAAATGQDGITILIAPAAKTNADLMLLGVTTNATVGSAADVVDANNDNNFKGLSIKQVVIHDNDGWTNGLVGAGPATYGGTVGATDNSGALVIGDGSASGSTVVFADNATPIRIELDMVGDNNGVATAGGGAMLNIAITTPTLGIKLGNIYVADSYNMGADGTDESSAIAIGTALAATDADNDTTVGVDGNAHRGRTKIISGFEIVMGGATTVIQLGNEAQGAMIVANTKLIGGLAIKNFALFDNDGATTAVGGAVSGSIAVGELKVTNNGTNTTELKLNVKVDAVGTGAAAPLGEGLYVNLAQVGDGTGIDVALNNVGIGSYTVATGVSTAKVIGDIQLLGLDVSGTTMIIRGH